MQYKYILTNGAGDFIKGFSNCDTACEYVENFEIHDGDYSTLIIWTFDDNGTKYKLMEYEWNDDIEEEKDIADIFADYIEEHLDEFIKAGILKEKEV